MAGGQVYCKKMGPRAPPFTKFYVHTNQINICACAHIIDTPQRTVRNSESDHSRRHAALSFGSSIIFLVEVPTPLDNDSVLRALDY